jgi:hypothetical protein
LLIINTGGTNNTYKWYKDDILLTDQTSNILLIPSVNITATGIYRVEVKNTHVTNLTLYGRLIKVNIDASNLNVQINKPSMNEKWIAGERDTIRWTGGASNQALKIDYSIDEGKTYENIGIIYPANIGKTGWKLPGAILTTRARIRISDYGTTNNLLDETSNFKIKPYIITKTILNTGGGFEYIPYDIKNDKWGFGNYSEEVWPAGWYNQFDNKKGSDQFTYKVYDQKAGTVLLQKPIHQISSIGFHL